jgi:hypothetical protein
VPNRIAKGMLTTSVLKCLDSRNLYRKKWVDDGVRTRDP